MLPQREKKSYFRSWQRPTKEKDVNILKRNFLCGYNVVLVFGYASMYEN